VGRERAAQRVCVCERKRDEREGGKRGRKEKEEKEGGRASQTKRGVRMREREKERDRGGGERREGGSQGERE